MPLENILGLAQNAIQNTPTPFDEASKGIDVGIKLSQLQQSIKANENQMEIHKRTLDDAWDEKMMGIVPKIFSKYSTPGERKTWFTMYNTLADRRGKPQISPELFELGKSNEGLSAEIAKKAAELQGLPPDIKRAEWTEFASGKGIASNIADLKTFVELMSEAGEKRDNAALSNQGRMDVKVLDGMQKKEAVALAEFNKTRLEGIKMGGLDKNSPLAAPDAFEKFNAGDAPTVKAYNDTLAKGSQLKADLVKSQIHKNYTTGDYSKMRLELRKNRLSQNVVTTASRQLAPFDMLDSRINNGISILSKKNLSQKELNEAVVDLNRVIANGVVSDNRFKELGFSGYEQVLTGFLSKFSGAPQDQPASTDAVKLYRDMFMRMTETNRLARSNIAAKNIDAGVLSGAVPADKADGLKAILTDPKGKQFLRSLDPDKPIPFNGQNLSLAAWRKALSNPKYTPAQRANLKALFKKNTGEEL